MRAQTILLLSITLFCGCVSQSEPKLEYQCWDGTIVTDIVDCPPTTMIKETTTTTTTTTTKPCPWTEDNCQTYCQQQCDPRPVEYCGINQTTCLCEFVCRTTTTTTIPILERWLTEKEIDEAINWGEENRFDLANILSEYSYPNYTVGYEHIIVYTPYLNLALRAASKAREYRKLSDEEIYEITTRREIEFRVKLYGNSKDFADDIAAVIKLRGEVIHPIETITDDSPETTAYWPGSPPYFAVNTYVFKDYGELRDREIRFVVIKHTGEEEYTIDMTDYR
ncbi:MAG: hypothetical protein JW778_04500 [Candidatus Altiarchaeota archaeon]|nr:hypothetical protein [Candidatus Altiarchaeota archaeon]